MRRKAIAIGVVGLALVSAAALARMLIPTPSEDDAPSPLQSAVASTSGEIAVATSEETPENGAGEPVEVAVAGSSGVLVILGMPILLCGDGSEIERYDAPGGQVTGAIAECAKLGELGEEDPMYSFSSESGEWVELSEGGWIEKSRVHAAEMLVDTGVTIALPCHHCAVVASKPGEILITGETDGCIFEECTYHEPEPYNEPTPEVEPTPEETSPEEEVVEEEEPEPEPEPSPEPEHEPALYLKIPLPAGLHLKNPRIVDGGYTPACCT